MCVGRYGTGARIICTQNATTGEEYRRGWHPERFTPTARPEQNVLIVGAGPAGMECAIVLAQRGMHSVHLVEAAGTVGGHLDWVAELPGMSAWRRVIDDRSTQLAKQRTVEVVTHRHLSVEDVLGYGADIVVVATGSHWATDGWNRLDRAPIPGADAALPHVVTPDQLMVARKPIPGERVLIYDSEGYFMGPTLAEKLARDGLHVQLVTPFAGPGPTMDFTGENLFLVPQLRRLGVEILAAHMVTRVGPGTVEGVSLAAPDLAINWTADAVILVTSRVPEDAIYRELRRNPEEMERSGIEAIYRIGDCFAPRLYVADAIFDGHRLAREIDSADPAEPLPYLRERALI